MKKEINKFLYFYRFLATVVDIFGFFKRSSDIIKREKIVTRKKERKEELSYWIKKLERAELKEFDKDILEKKYKIDYKNLLNERQLVALTAVDGQYLVIAGAGSGKTRTIVYRTAFILEQGVDEKEILMLTFTRKSAFEMKERLKKLLEREELETEVLTFHSLCGRIIFKNSRIFDSKNMRILDEEENIKLIDSLLKRYPVNLSPERVGEIMEGSKNRKRSIESFLRRDEKKYLKDLVKFQERYESFKEERKLFTFDNLIERVLKELKKNVKFRNFFQNRYKYIVVDEYQDTNTLQRELLKYLVGDDGNLMAVGDDCQSIYGFRGADFENILKFSMDFPKAHLIKLEINYRSTDEIIEYSKIISEKFLLKYEKNIRGVGEKGEKPQILSFKDEERQWDFICNKIEELHQVGVPYKEIAILYRNRHTVHLLEKILKKREINYDTGGEEGKGERVSLISCHKSKGLEWEVVFIPTLLEGIFPSSLDEKNLEEEKRLFYVACTRSKRFLYLLYTEYFYEKVGYFNKKSSFLNF